MEIYMYFAVAAALSRLVPLGVGIRRWGSLALAGRLIVVFVAISVVVDLGQLVLGPVFSINNLWIGHASIAVQTPLLLFAFSEWGDSTSIRRGIRIAAVVSLVGWVLLTIAVETPNRYARVTGPLQAAVFCLAASIVLIRRGLSSELPPSRADWFWVSLGILVLYSVTAVYQPLLDLFTTKGITAIPAWTVLKSMTVLTVLANLMYARGLHISGAIPLRPVPAPA
jgi:hypothetical protein